MFPLIPAGMSPWWYFICVGLSVLIMAVGKGGFGGGGIGILAIPLMALVLGARQMLGVMLIVLILCDLLANLFYLRDYDVPRLKWMVLGGLIGIGVGTIIFWQLRGIPPAMFGRITGLLVGVLCLLIVLLQCYRLMGGKVPTLPPHPASGVAVGVVAGTLSTLNHAAGPVTTLYLLQEKLEKRKLVGTMLLYTLIGNIAKLPTFLLLTMPDGRTLIDAAVVRDCLWFLPLIPLGILGGVWMNRRVPEKPFIVIMYIATAVVAGQMIWKSIQ